MIAPSFFGGNPWCNRRKWSRLFPSSAPAGLSTAHILARCESMAAFLRGLSSFRAFFLTALDSGHRRPVWAQLLPLPAFELEKILRPWAKIWLWQIPFLFGVSAVVTDSHGATHSASWRCGKFLQLPALAGMTATHSPVRWRYCTTGRLNCQSTKASSPRATANAAMRSLIIIFHTFDNLLCFLNADNCPSHCCWVYP